MLAKFTQQQSSHLVCWNLSFRKRHNNSSFHCYTQAWLLCPPEGLEGYSHETRVPATKDSGDCTRDCSLSIPPTTILLHRHGTICTNHRLCHFRKICLIALMFSSPHNCAYEIRLWKSKIGYW